MNTYRITIEFDVVADTPEAARERAQRWLDTSADFEWLCHHAKVQAHGRGA